MRWLDSVTETMNMNLDSVWKLLKGGLVCWSPWSHEELDMTEQLNSMLDCLCSTLPWSRSISASQWPGWNFLNIGLKCSVTLVWIACLNKKQSFPRRYSFLKRTNYGPGFRYFWLSQFWASLLSNLMQISYWTAKFTANKVCSVIFTVYLSASCGHMAKYSSFLMRWEQSPLSCKRQYYALLGDLW